ncbi:hypothetical protein DDB_G0286189 [Dictyostelium discoideum AX4]|uniref:Small ubiquitin-like protein n=1 Tax=Dictyostelium discoideum TaxID=44689 RepID=Q8N0B4_DICDI|nr:hypothetical protein DDB_G0286189 [Dictyostelium discoideum AX4]AAM21559.1 small ubiquitin-like protein [Dictyostelium discoideum]EAL64270.1 hypothetical protein DDB_G0286189 [Dictyostelium discoideum AX4]|eukprot:XP_637795.1 hypothetical protein DDB_G0286189 [Dictyostelium discoideum AX4]
MENTKEEPGVNGEAPVKDEHINLKVKNQGGGEVFFKIKRSTPLKKLMEAYCQRQGLNYASCRFLFDGVRVKEDATPNQLGMENEDVLDCALMQTGGSF